MLRNIFKFFGKRKSSNSSQIQRQFLSQHSSGDNVFINNLSTRIVEDQITSWQNHVKESSSDSEMSLSSSDDEF